jgi:hypothetical protein
LSSVPLVACKKQKAKLVIAKLDRLSRNLAFIATLMDSGVEFVAVDNPHANKLTVHILAAVAQHEREIISARTSAALKAAKTRGKRLGNPKLSGARRHAAAARKVKCRSLLGECFAGDPLNSKERHRIHSQSSARAVSGGAARRCHEHRDFEPRRHSFIFLGGRESRASGRRYHRAKIITQPEPRFHLGLILADVGALVTHDLDEAVVLSDRICVLDGGETLQTGAPAELVKAPGSDRVADALDLPAAAERIP